MRTPRIKVLVLTHEEMQKVLWLPRTSSIIGVNSPNYGRVEVAVSDLHFPVGTSRRFRPSEKAVILKGRRRPTALMSVGSAEQNALAARFRQDFIQRGGEMFSDSLDDFIERLIVSVREVIEASDCQSPSGILDMNDEDDDDDLD